MSDNKKINNAVIDNEYNNIDSDEQDIEYETTYEEGTDVEKSGNQFAADEKYVTDDNGMLPDGRIVLCGANSYEQKFYFNKRFSKLPESIRKELNIICVLFTEEVGGIFYIVFDEEGGISLETNADSDDICYDEVSSGLLIGEIRRSRMELMESLSLYYRVIVLKEKPEDILKEIGEE